MISWWCVALEEPWTWEWIPYPGIWVVSILPIIVYLRATARSGETTTPRQRAQFIAGMIVFWLASDWPLGTLGAGYLASAHMAQFLLYTLVSVPLLLLGTPEWMAERVLGRLRLRGLAARLGSSLVLAGVTYNVLLALTHAPGVVSALRTSQWGSFFMDVVWMIAGFVLWLPVISPIRSIRNQSDIGRMLYLFATTSLVAVIPASFLTFTTMPIYSIYELAPRIGSLTARADQQLAGIVMKIGSIPIIWSTIGVIWFRWAAKEQQRQPVG
ncbi:MAG TPA: cytochrome c oxidase assembly protein [Acidimicrobiia bacterium]|nr:cytochrome c oxidase assembly protein [Acidimicrobiia bacterium]